MGKVKPRILGLEEVEEAQKLKQKEKAAKKKMAKKKEEPKFAPLTYEVNSGAPEKAKVAEKKQKKENVRISNTTTGKKKTHGKKYMEVAKLADKNKIYKLEEAVMVLKKMKTAKFDETVELHLVVTETGLKGEVSLPHSTGKTVRVAVVDDKLLEKLEAGKIEFDVLVTHPSFMPRLAKFAKFLGPRGLMPNPKAGTISPKPEDVVRKFEKGVLRWKTEPKFPLIHQMIGKISFEDKNLIENAAKFMETVGSSKIQSAYLKSTMSPSIKIAIS